MSARDRRLRVFVAVIADTVDADKTDGPETCEDAAAGPNAEERPCLAQPAAADYRGRGMLSGRPEPLFDVHGFVEMPVAFPSSRATIRTPVSPPYPVLVGTVAEPHRPQEGEAKGANASEPAARRARELAMEDEVAQLRADVTDLESQLSLAFKSSATQNGELANDAEGVLAKLAVVLGGRCSTAWLLSHAVLGRLGALSSPEQPANNTEATCRQLQDTEIEALRGIYGARPHLPSPDDFVAGPVSSPPAFKLRLMPNPLPGGARDAVAEELAGNHAVVLLAVKFRPLYPSADTADFSVRGLVPTQLRELDALVSSEGRAHAGSECVFYVASAVQQFLVAHNRAPGMSLPPSQAAAAAAAAAAQAAQAAAVQAASALPVVTSPTSPHRIAVTSSDERDRDVRELLTPVAVVAPASPTTVCESGRSPARAPHVRRGASPAAAAAAEAESASTATEVAGYRGVRVVRRSALGNMYKGVDERTGEVVALKEVVCVGRNAASKARARETLAQFVRGVGRSVTHTNIASYRDLERDGDVIYIVRQFAARGCVSDRLERAEKKGEAPVAESDIARAMSDALRGLCVLHERRLVHGAIKCSNFLLLDDGAVALADWGLVDYLNVLCGAEQAPEPFERGQRNDVYMLGLAMMEFAKHQPREWSAAARDFLDACLRGEKQRPKAPQLLMHAFVSAPSALACAVSPLDVAAGLASSMETPPPGTARAAQVPHMSRYEMDFKELGPIGEGAFGSVVRAQNKLDERVYAIKKIRYNAVNQRAFDKMLREVTTLSRLHHENVVRYYQAWVETIDPGQLPDTPRSDSDDSPDDADDGYLSGGAPSDADDDEYGSGDDDDDSGDEDDDGYDDQEEDDTEGLGDGEGPLCCVEVEECSGSEAGRSKDGLALVGGLSTAGFDEPGDSWITTSSSSAAAHAQHREQQRHQHNANTSGEDELSAQDPALFLASPQGSTDAEAQSRRRRRRGGRNKGSKRGRKEKRRAPEPRMLYIQMEYCPKKTLRNVIDDHAYTEDTMWKMFRQVVDGLNHIHRQGIIHRDLKPANIFIDEADNAKIGDFGLSTESSAVHKAMTPASTKAVLQGLDRDSTHTSHVGTPTYTSPEVLDGRTRSYDHKVDIYSLGIIFFEMCHPFGTRMEAASAIRALKERLELPAGFEGTRPREAQLIRWMLRPRASDRPTAAEIGASPLVPKKLEDEILKAAVVQVVQPETSIFQFLVQQLFANTGAHGSDVPDIPALSARAAATKELVIDTLQALFRVHGALHVDTPLLVPRDGTAGSDGALCLMEETGTVVALRQDLTAPFARALGGGGAGLVQATGQYAGMLKRYDVGRVYNTAPGGQRRTVVLGAFDIVGDQSQRTVHDAEAVKVAADVLCAFFDAAACFVRVGHEKLARLVLHSCRVDSAKTPAVCAVLGQHPLPPAWRQQLAEAGVAESSIQLLSRVCTRGELTEHFPAGEDLFPAPCAAAQQAQEALRELRLLARYVGRLGVRCRVFYDPWLWLSTEAYYEGCIVLQGVYGRPPQPRATTLAALSLLQPVGADAAAAAPWEKVVSGGRYDALVYRYRDKGSIGLQPGAVGFNVAIEAIASRVERSSAHASKQTGALQQRRSGPCDVHVFALGRHLTDDKLAVAAALWERGVRADLLAVDTTSANEAVGRSRDAGVPWLIVLHERLFRERGAVQVINTRTRAAEEVALRDLVAHVARLQGVALVAAAPGATGAGGDTQRQGAQQTGPFDICVLHADTPEYRRTMHDNCLRFLRKALPDTFAKVRVAAVDLPLPQVRELAASGWEWPALERSERERTWGNQAAARHDRATRFVSWVRKQCELSPPPPIVVVFSYQDNDIEVVHLAGLAKKLSKQ
eukprot:m51a1_g13898 hypothetical protein (1861) ;mRNA; r:731884-740836